MSKEPMSKVLVAEQTRVARMAAAEVKKMPIFEGAPDEIVAAYLTTVLSGLGKPGSRQRESMMALLRLADDVYYAGQMMKD